MTTGRFRRNNDSYRPTGARRSDRENNFFLALIGCSLLLHIIAFAIFQHTPAPAKPHRPPAVYVDLVATPVANPQRGSAALTSKTPAPVKKETTVPARTAKEEPVLKNKESQKLPPAEKSVDMRAEIAKMRKRLAAQAEEEEIQTAIAAMKKKSTHPLLSPPTIGSAAGTGDEAGSAIGEWLQRAVKAKWIWPDRKRKDLSAEVEVEFDASGKLSHYNFRRSSGDARFDKSLKDALLKLETLPKPLRKPFKETILFNLEELQRL